MFETYYEMIYNELMKISQLYSFREKLTKQDIKLVVRVDEKTVYSLTDVIDMVIDAKLKLIGKILKRIKEEKGELKK